MADDVFYAVHGAGDAHDFVELLLAVDRADVIDNAVDRPSAEVDGPHAFGA